MSENRINIVQIQTALLIPVTAQFITDKLGIKPVATEKRAVYWSREQFVDICQGLIRQITNVRNVNFDAISGQRPKKDDPAPPPAADSFEFGESEADNSAPFEFGDAEPAAEEGFFA